MTLYFWYTSSFSFFKLLLILSALTLILLFYFLTLEGYPALWTDFWCSVWGTVVSGEIEMKDHLNSFSRWAVTHRSSWVFGKSVIMLRIISCPNVQARNKWSPTIICFSGAGDLQMQFWALSSHTMKQLLGLPKSCYFGTFSLFRIQLKFWRQNSTWKRKGNTLFRKLFHLLPAPPQHSSQ